MKIDITFDVTLTDLAIMWIDSKMQEHRTLENIAKLDVSPTDVKLIVNHKLRVYGSQYANKADGEMLRHIRDHNTGDKWNKQVAIYERLIESVSNTLQDHGIYNR